MTPLLWACIPAFYYMARTATSWQELSVDVHSPHALL
jgi:hypothetical protein